MSGRAASGPPPNRPRSGTAAMPWSRPRPGCRATPSAAAVGEFAVGGAPAGRLRRPGAGLPGIETLQPGLTAALEALVDPVTRGDPTSALRWTCKSKAKLAAALTTQGWRVSATTVGLLLRDLGYRLQALQKTLEGSAHS